MLVNIYYIKNNESILTCIIYKESKQFTVLFHKLSSLLKDGKELVRGAHKILFQTLNKIKYMH